MATGLFPHALALARSFLKLSKYFCRVKDWRGTEHEAQVHQVLRAPPCLHVLEHQIVFLCRIELIERLLKHRQ